MSKPKPEPDPDQDTPFDFPEHRLAVAGELVLAYRSAPVTAAALWWAVEDLQVVGCGAWWVVAP